MLWRMKTLIQLTTTEGGPLFDMGFRVAAVSSALLIVLFLVGVIAQAVKPEATNHFMKVIITVLMAAFLIGLTIMMVAKEQQAMSVAGILPPYLILYVP